MAGQIIILPGVTAASGASTPRIDMTAADRIAAKMPGLKHVVSARSLTALPTGGVSGRCRSTGRELIPKGVTNALRITEIDGKKALGLTAVLAAGLALPPGSKSASYTTVCAVRIGQADIDSVTSSTSPMLISGSSSDDVMNLNVLQYFGAAGTPPNIFTARGSTASSPFAQAVRPSGTWSIVIVDYNNDTKTVSLSVNQADTFATSVKSVAHTPGANDYIEIGNHSNSTSSLRVSSVGDLFTFNASLRGTALGLQQLKELVAALKAEYSIA